MENVTFEAIDVQAATFTDIYDYALRALRVIRQPGGRASQRAGGAAARRRLNMEVWRRKLDNDWLQRSPADRRRGLVRSVTVPA